MVGASIGADHGLGDGRAAAIPASPGQRWPPGKKEGR